MLLVFACTAFDQQQPVSGSADSPPYLHSSDPIDRQHVSSLLLIRVGAHDLGTALDRWHRIPRQTWLCSRCTGGCMDDEFHMVFDCLFILNGNASVCCMSS